MNNRAFGIGVGGEKHHVSYLSPLLYSGTSLEFWYENIIRHSKGDKDFYRLLNNRAHVGFLYPTHEGADLNPIFELFEFHEYYDWKVTPKFHFLCGAYVGYELGVDMMMSNSNNPLYLRFDLSLGLSLRPTLCLHTKRRLIKLSDQMDLRLGGLVMSPTYTQLYYDLTLPDYDRSEFFDLNSFPEKLRFVNKLMVELPLRRNTLRLGLLTERSQSMINLIDNRTTNIQALWGVSFDYYHLKGRLDKDSKFVTVFE